MAERGPGIVEQVGALGVGGEHGLERSRRAGRSLLRDIADPRRLRRLGRALVASMRPATTFIKVDLPAPLRPISPTRLPGGSAAEARSRIRRPPRRTVMALRDSIARPYRDGPRLSPQPGDVRIGPAVHGPEATRCGH